MTAPLIRLRPYQEPIFRDRTTGIVVLHWARQIGKSFTLAAWAVDRLLTQLQRHRSWLVTVLSNSRENGAEFVGKCAAVCRLLGLAAGPEGRGEAGGAEAVSRFALEDLSADIHYANMRMEVRVSLGVGAAAREGRIKVLAANPRTARGFSGDLILDEFAFHEDSQAIWEAAEPILAANAEYLCRIASTGNGKFNLFYRMVTSGPFVVSRVSRAEAWRQGVPVYDPVTRHPITPAAARGQALDKAAYDQNYELSFRDENRALLTQELIGAAERLPPSAALPATGANGDPTVPASVDEQVWSSETLTRLADATQPFYVGHDIGRYHDLSVVTVLARIGPLHRVVGMLRMEGVRLPAQQAQLDRLCGLARFAAYEGDLSGLGLGLVEYLQAQWGGQRIRGVNFASSAPVSEPRLGGGRTTARVTELMATALLTLFEDRLIEIPVDARLREDLRKPEKIATPSGRVSIAATRDEAGHADHFWSLALAVRAAARPVTSTVCRGFKAGLGPLLTQRRARALLG